MTAEKIKQRASTTAPVIAIDGPSGTGKGTLSLKLARELGWHLLDSGAVYRVLALAALDTGEDLDDGVALAALAMELDVHFGEDKQTGAPDIELGGALVTDRIREHRVSDGASRVARHPEVRQALLRLQQDFRRLPGLVADGRDMGSTVFPDAELKFFLTASPEIRAERRYKQLKNKEQSDSLPGLLRDIRQRDERDAQRSTSPMRASADAILIDSSDLSVDEVFEAMLAAARERGLC